MTILVTGATGLLGNNIVRLLLHQGHQVRVLTRSKDVSQPLRGLVVELALGDVRDHAAVALAMQNVRQVIHCAGHVHIGWSQEELHRSINVEGTRHVAETAHAIGAQLAYVSSVNALGLGKRDFAANEDTALPGIVDCPYVRTKREAEQIVLSQVQKGLNAVILNPGFMLGPWDWKPSSGRMMLEVARRFMPLAPSGSFSVCDVRDVALGVLAALEKGKSGRHYILGGENISYFELWKRFARVTGARGPYFPAGPLQRCAAALWGDLWHKITGQESDLNSAGVRMSSQHHRFRSDRAIAELGYRIRPMEETLRDAWQWFVEHGYTK